VCVNGIEFDDAHGTKFGAHDMRKRRSKHVKRVPNCSKDVNGT